MTLAIRLILAVLAVYRVAHLIGLERGPFDAALRFRLAVARRFPAVKQYGRASYQHWLAEGVTCPLCYLHLLQKHVTLHPCYISME